MATKQCGQKCEVYSRVVGYHRPVQNWNKGKKEEFSDRSEFSEVISLDNNIAKRELPVSSAISEIVSEKTATCAEDDSNFF